MRWRFKPRRPNKDGVELCLTYCIIPDKFLKMIESYRDKRTRAFAEGGRIKAFAGIQRQAELKLDQLEAALTLRELALPGNRLEALRGGRKGQYSIRVNDQWRVCFEWPKGSLGPVNVEIVDYH